MLKDSGPWPASSLQTEISLESYPKRSARLCKLILSTKLNILLSIRCCERWRRHRTGKLPLGNLPSRMEKTWRQVITIVREMCTEIVGSRKASWRRPSLNWISERAERSLWCNVRIKEWVRGRGRCWLRRLSKRKESPQAHSKRHSQVFISLAKSQWKYPGFCMFPFGTERFTTLLAEADTVRTVLLVDRGELKFGEGEFDLLNSHYASTPC